MNIEAVLRVEELARIWEELQAEAHATGASLDKHHDAWVEDAEDRSRQWHDQT